MRVFLKIVKHQVKSFSYKENMEHTFPYEIDDMNIMKNIDNGQLYIDNNVLVIKDTIKLTLAEKIKKKIIKRNGLKEIRYDQY